MKPLFFIVLLVLLPIAHAFDCTTTTDEASCTEVLAQGLPTSDEEYLLAELVYPFSLPNYTFIEEYNTNIVVTDPPENTTMYSSTQITHAWLSFLAVFPAVYEQSVLYVPSKTKTLCAYGYDVVIPDEPDEDDCDTYYRLRKNTADLAILLNKDEIGNGTFAIVPITESGTLTAKLTIDTSLEVEHWKWHVYCCEYKKGACIRWCKRCQYDSVESKNDQLVLTEDKEVVRFSQQPSAQVTIINTYYGTLKGIFITNNATSVELLFDHAFTSFNQRSYTVAFDKRPYYFITLVAENASIKKSFNINWENTTTFVTKNSTNCTVTAANFFYELTAPCDLTLHPTETVHRTMTEQNSDLDLLILLMGITYLTMYLLKKICEKLRFVLIVCVVISLFMVPHVHAEGEEECGLTNLASCIPAYLYDFFLELVNAPLQPLLDAVQALLTTQVSIDLFYEVWLIMCYVLSFFYLFLFLWAGFSFLTSGGNTLKRAQAKETVQNAVLMILFISASYYLYDLLLSMVSSLTSSLWDMIPPEFFLLTYDSFINAALEGIMVMSYVFTLFVTLFLLVVRYLVVSIGVALAPLGIFCYYIPPIRSYGRFILSVLGLFMGVVVIDLLIILAGSLIIQASVFSDLKIMVMIATFSLVNYSLYWSIKFTITRSSFGSVRDDLDQALKYLAWVM